MDDTCVEQLRARVRQLGHIAVAYSGGVDSTFLLAMCAHELGTTNIVAVTVESPLIPTWDTVFAAEFCRTRSIPHRRVDGSSVLHDATITANTPERCYYCKLVLLQKMREAVDDTYTLLSGTNASDEGDFRPGMRAEEELGVIAPLRECRFTSDMIRRYSKHYGVPGCERVSGTCFATRIPAGEALTEEKICMVRDAECGVRSLGFDLVRVRLLPPDTACVEVDRMQVARSATVHGEIVTACQAAGFDRVMLDLEGYRQGKWNRPPRTV